MPPTTVVSPVAAPGAGSYGYGAGGYAGPPTRFVPVVPGGTGGGLGAVPPTTVPPGGPSTAGSPLAGPPGPGPKGREKKLRIGAGALGVVALLGIGWFVFQGLSGKSGGSSSPDGAVNALVAAVNKKDVAGAVAALNPDEVAELGDALQTVQDRATKTGAAPKGDALAGFDIKIDNVKLSDEKLSADVVKVNLDDGDAEASFDADKLATRVKEIDAHSDSASFDRDDLVVHRCVDGCAREETVEPFVMVVKRAGGWYVSPEYTLLQYWVEANDLPDPDFSAKLPTGVKGASSPKEALEGLANSLDRMKVEDWISFVPDNERRALWAYQDAVDKIVDKNDYDNAFSFDVQESEVIEKSLSGGDKSLTVTSARGTARGRESDGKSAWRYDGRCVRTGSGEDASKFCADHRFEFVNARWSPVGSLYQVMGDGGTLVAQRDHGGWVISPLASVARTLKEQLASASTEELYAWIGAPELAPSTGSLTIGKRKRGVFNKGGYAVFDVSLKKGVRYNYQREVKDGEDRDCQGIYGCDHAADFLVRSGNSFRGNFDAAYIFEAGRSLSDRLVVFGNPSSSYSLLLGELPRKPMPGAHVSGTITEDVPAIDYLFTVNVSGTWQIAMEDSDAFVEVTRDGGIDVYSGNGSSYDLDAGTEYAISVSGPIGTGYDVTLRRGGATLDGSTSVTGSVYGTSEGHHALEIIDASTVTLQLTFDSSDGTDLDMAVGGSDCTSDGGSSSDDGSEVVTVTGPCSGSVEVYAYGGEGGSSYTLTVEDQ
jgi:hypothetical protein